MCQGSMTESQLKHPKSLIPIFFRRPVYTYILFILVRNYLKLVLRMNFINTRTEGAAGPLVLELGGPFCLFVFTTTPMFVPIQQLFNFTTNYYYKPIS